MCLRSGLLKGQMIVANWRNGRGFGHVALVALLPLGFAAVSACASVEKTDKATPDIFDEVAFWEKTYQDWFRDALSAFGEPALDSDEAQLQIAYSDYVRVIVLPSFRRPLLFGARRDKPEALAGPLTYFYFKTFGRGESGPKDIGSRNIRPGGLAIPQQEGLVTWSKQTIETYAVRVSPEEFDEAFKGVTEAGVADLPIVKKDSGSGCEDGTTYFIDFAIAGERTFYARHSCDPTFKEDFALASPLMVAGSTKFREFSNLLTDYDQRIRGGVIDQIDQGSWD